MWLGSRRIGAEWRRGNRIRWAMEAQASGRNQRKLEPKGWQWNQRLEKELENTRAWNRSHWPVTNQYNGKGKWEGKCKRKGETKQEGDFSGRKIIRNDKTKEKGNARKSNGRQAYIRWNRQNQQNKHIVIGKTRWFARPKREKQRKGWWRFRTGKWDGGRKYRN